MSMKNAEKSLSVRHGCSLLNLLHILRAPFPKNTSGRLLLLGKDFAENVQNKIKFQELKKYSSLIY